MEISAVRRLRRLIPLCFLLLQPAIFAAPAAVQLSSVVEYPDSSATATVVSLSSATLSAQLNAVVKTVHREVGDHVERGERLLTLDCSDYQLSEDIAKAELEAAKANAALALSQAKRSRQLLERKLTSQQDNDDKEAGFIASRAREDLASANLKQAQLNVSRCDITAPFGGVITNRHLSTGQLAAPGTSLFTLVDDGNLEVSAQVSADKASQITGDTETWFTSDMSYEIRLARAVGAIDTNTRTREFRFQFTGKRPLPGSAGKIHWRSPRPHLPAKYLVTRDSLTGFLILDNTIARFIPLPGAFPGRAQVIDIDLDTLILVPPLGDLSDGDTVQGTATPAEGIQ